MSETRNREEDVWALARSRYDEWGIPLAIIPWGGDRAVIVTVAACYLAEADPEMGFSAKLMFRR